MCIAEHFYFLWSNMWRATNEGKFRGRGKWRLSWYLFCHILFVVFLNIYFPKAENHFFLFVRTLSGSFLLSVETLCVRPWQVCSASPPLVTYDSLSSIPKRQQFLLNNQVIKGVGLVEEVIFSFIKYGSPVTPTVPGSKTYQHFCGFLGCFI